MLYKAYECGLIQLSVINSLKYSPEYYYYNILTRGCSRIHRPLTCCRSSAPVRRGCGCWIETAWPSLDEISGKKNVLDFGKTTTNNNIVKTTMASSDCNLQWSRDSCAGSREFFDVDLRVTTIHNIFININVERATGSGGGPWTMVNNKQ